jgi:hypothetical protein
VVHGVLDEVELAALVGNAFDKGFDGSAQTLVIVADDSAHAMEAALLERFQEAPAVNLGFTEGTTGAEDGTAAVLGDTNGYQNRAVPQTSIDTYFFKPGIQHEIGLGSERAVAPRVELGFEFGGGATDLGTGDAQTTEGGEDLVDLSCGDALDVHLSHGQQECLIGTRITLQRRGIKLDVAADLRNVEAEGPQGCVKRFGLKAIGVALSGGGAPVGFCVKDGGAFQKHGFVEEDLEDLREGVGAFL